MRVMTYNISSGRNVLGDRDMDFARRTISAEEPDILGLNEVQHFSCIFPGKCAAEELARRMGYLFFQFGRAIDYADGEYGNALLSRFPIVETAVFPIPDLPAGKRDGDYESRSILRNVLRDGDQLITVLNTHFGQSEGEAYLAAAEVSRLVKRENNPLILMGDFNLEPAHPFIQELSRLLEDTAEGTAFPTYPADVPNQKLDYIFVSRHFRVQRAWVPESLDSDHRPFLAEIDWHSCRKNEMSG